MHSRRVGKGLPANRFFGRSDTLAGGTGITYTVKVKAQSLHLPSPQQRRFTGFRELTGAGEGVPAAA